MPSSPNRAQTEAASIGDHLVTDSTDVGFNFEPRDA